MPGPGLPPFKQVREQLLESLPLAPALSSLDGPGALVRGHLVLCADVAGVRSLDSPSTEDEKLVLSAIGDDVLSTMRLGLSGLQNVSTQTFINQQCLLRDEVGMPRGVFFLVEMRNDQGSLVYTRSGLCQYRNGPAFTHVRADFSRDSRLCMSPLLSYAAFGEDLNRINKSGTQIALGHKGSSHILDEVLCAVRAIEGAQYFEPSGIRQIIVSDRSEGSAQVALSTVQFGWHIARVQLVPGRWRVEVNVSKRSRPPASFILNTPKTM